MADRRLDEVSAATDFSYAYTEDSSNNQVKISKADMASVLAASMGNPIRQMGVLQGIVDFDNIQNGTWMVGKVTDEGSVSKPGNYGVLLQYGTGYTAQIFVSNSGRWYVRNHNGNGAWNEWKQITTTAL